MRCFRNFIFFLIFEVLKPKLFEFFKFSDFFKVKVFEIFEAFVVFEVNEVIIVFEDIGLFRVTRLEITYISEIPILFSFIKVL